MNAGHPSFHVQEQYDKSGRIWWGCGKPHPCICSKTPSDIGKKSGQNESEVYVRVLTVPGTCTWSLYVCACLLNEFLVISSRDARTRGWNSIMTVIAFRSSRFSDKAFVGNSKALSENLSFAKKNHRRNICWTLCLVEKNACRSLSFSVVLIYIKATWIRHSY